MGKKDSIVVLRIRWCDIGSHYHTVLAVSEKYIVLAIKLLSIIL